jgi:ABC-type nitrate/sulfonate/bicarbonate transport system ATPase subunit
VLDVQIRSKAFPSTGVAGRQILRNVCFSAARGEILALLGPSGIGKSTVLRIVLGLDPMFEGSIRRPPGRMGVMFQEPRLLPWLSVEENLLLVRPAGARALDIAALLDDVLLPPVAKAMPGELSLGMARRVALARALAVDPETLVLDEPFASLDINLAAALGARIADRVRRRGMMVLMSTHDVDQALAIASRILVVANDPATLVTDVAVPDRDDALAIGQLHRNLLTRFTFLGRGRLQASCEPE